MGISKAMMEHVIYANARVAAERGGTTICCTRYGNVMCSRGSVIPLFIDQIKAGKGMVGTALCNNLKNIRDGKNKTRSEIAIEEIYEYDLGSTAEELDEYCQKSDFIFNLAGVNRPENPEDFMKGNFGFASALLDCLKKHNNKATIMLSSSIQATFSDGGSSAPESGED